MADDDLRRLVQSSAAPPPGEAPMGSIRARARRRRLRRRAATVVVPLLLVSAGVATALTSPLGQRVELAPAEPAATAEATPTPTPTATPAPTPTGEPEPAPVPTPTTEADEQTAGVEEVTVYFARDHAAGVWVEPEVVALDEPTVGVARAAMEVLVGHAPTEPGRFTLAAEGAEVLDVTIEGDVLVVDFHGLVDPQGVGGSSYEAALISQIAHTGAQFDNIRAVQILIDGAPVESLGGHFVITDPIEPGPITLSPVTITSHRSGDRVDLGDVTVAGEACTFEGTVELTLLGPDGSAAAETFATATTGCPERGGWEHTFTIDAPGTWTINAAEPDQGEGRPPFDVSVELEAS